MYNSKSKPGVPLRRSLGQVAACVIFFIVVFYCLMVATQTMGVSIMQTNSVGSPKVFQAGLTEDALNDLPKESYSYLTMIDAGSSGCRAHIFRYGLLGSSTGPLYILPKHSSKKVRPGLSTFAANPTMAGDSLRGLIDFMKEEVPESEWSRTPIWLKATAGLRMLDDASRDAIISSVRNFLGSSQNSPFYFQPDFAQVIPGVEEGAFGWISVNYMKRIIGPFRSSQGVPTPENAYAVVEMGGASTQVTQIVNSPSDIPSNQQSYQYSFTIQGQRYQLYTHSYLGYGGDQARAALNKHLVSTQVKTQNDPHGTITTTLVDPCLNPGYFREQGKTSGDVYTGPVGEFHVVGGSDDKADKCHQAVEDLLFPLRNGEKSANCAEDIDTVSFNCIYQPSFVRHSKNVLVFENFFYAASGMGTMPAGHEPLFTSERTTSFPLKTSPKEFLDSAQEVCGLTWDKVAITLPRDKSPKEQNARWCFSASYAYLFLTHGIGFDENKVITVQQNIDGSDIEWALGAAYREAAATLGNQYLRVA
mmetsp:Transcript_10470/g.15960  ORF Transcript_10470/g.15960 Transcript_10470/m.15960 type:complete len:532 (-) Transcript_10470:54-1649(-)